MVNVTQMAKRMKFSVIGLPHYTIWHLYEPSVDDLRHMEEMELERLAREREEQERAEQKDGVQPKSQDSGHDAISVKGSADGTVAQSKDDAKDSQESSQQTDKTDKIPKAKQ
jgi:mannan polymerase II complex ANP1 subunit